MKKITKRPKKIKLNNKKIDSQQNFKKKYFEFYDDIKDYTNGKEDW